jgi:sec-independent protein translocase protein TatB
MFFDLSLPEIVVLLGLGVVLFGPDKLPQAAASAARFLRQVRAFSDNAREDLRKELGPEFDGLNLEDLNPKTFVRKNLLGEGEELRDLRKEINGTLNEAVTLNPAAAVPAPRPTERGQRERRAPGGRAAAVRRRRHLIAPSCQTPPDPRFPPRGAAGRARDRDEGRRPAEGLRGPDAQAESGGHSRLAHGPPAPPDQPADALTGFTEADLPWYGLDAGWQGPRASARSVRARTAWSSSARCGTATRRRPGRTRGRSAGPSPC